MLPFIARIVENVLGENGQTSEVCQTMVELEARNAREADQKAKAVLRDPRHAWLVSPCGSPERRSGRFPIVIPLGESYRNVRRPRLFPRWVNLESRYGEGIHTLIACCAITMIRPSVAADAMNGKDIAKRWCASCHLVENGQTSGTDQAPPFSPILQGCRTSTRTSLRFCCCFLVQICRTCR